MLGGKTLEQHRRAMGDRVKAKISVEKWCIEARTQATISDVEPEVLYATSCTAWSSLYDYE